jgi:hypothetical protein
VTPVWHPHKLGKSERAATSAALPWGGPCLLGGPSFKGGPLMTETPCLTVQRIFLCRAI